MLKMLVFASLAFIIVCSASPSRAADYQGRTLDGHIFRATMYGPQGAEPAVVSFNRDEARVQLLDGEGLIVVLYSRSFDDLHFVTGKSLDGRFYRLDLNESVWMYGSGLDPFFMPFATNSSTRGPIGPAHHGGHHGG